MKISSVRYADPNYVSTARTVTAVVGERGNCSSIALEDGLVRIREHGGREVAIPLSRCLELEFPPPAVQSSPAEMLAPIRPDRIAVGPKTPQIIALLRREVTVPAWWLALLLVGGLLLAIRWVIFG